MANDEDRDAMQAEFQTWLKTKKGSSACTFMTKEQYDRILMGVLKAKCKQTKSKQDKQLLQNYDVILSKGKHELVSAAKDSEGLLYITTDKLFYTLQFVHEILQHGGKMKMYRELRSKYKNISYHQIGRFVDLCRVCQARRNEKAVERSFENIVKGQIDVIENDEDNGFRFILVYQDVKTKFTVLKALKENLAQTVAEKLIHIFALIGAPMVLQSNRDEEYLKSIIFVLKTIWPAVKILYAPKDDAMNGCDDFVVEIKNLLLSSMINSNSNSWSKALPFVQFVKNSEMNSDIGKTPYEAYFGMPPRLGMQSMGISPEVVQRMESEADLHRFLEDPESFDKQPTSQIAIPLIINLPAINTPPPEPKVVDFESHPVDLNCIKEDVDEDEEENLDENLHIATKRQHDIIRSLEEDLNECLSSSSYNITEIKEEIEDDNMTEGKTTKRENSPLTRSRAKKSRTKN